jgi:hypothetical protein
MFRNHVYWLTGVIGLVFIQLGDVNAQPGRRPNRGAGANETKTTKIPELPNDPKLLRIHKAFTDEAMKIARDYERDRDFDSAMAIYGQVLRLIPAHPDAKNKLNMLREREKQADRIQTKVDAAKTWQSTGIRVLENKPITILSRGSWTFTLKRELDTNGMAIPKELQDFNLGCLVGFIDTGQAEKEKAFVIGAKKELIPKRSGVLYLQMYDVDVSDNEGEIDVQITGTFERVTKGARK